MVAPSYYCEFGQDGTPASLTTCHEKHYLSQPFSTALLQTASLRMVPGFLAHPCNTGSYGFEPPCAAAAVRNKETITPTDLASTTASIVSCSCSLCCPGGRSDDRETCERGAGHMHEGVGAGTATRYKDVMQHS